MSERAASYLYVVTWMKAMLTVEDTPVTSRDTHHLGFPCSAKHQFPWQPLPTLQAPANQPVEA